MPFCINCGKQFPDGAKFCPACGAPTTKTQEQRKQEYAGEIQKCPNCGTTISAFEATCRSCGYELRNAKASNAVQSLADTIAKIEATRPSQTPSTSTSSIVSNGKRKDRSKSSIQEIQEMQEMYVTPTDRSIANVIQNFAIPNNREDLLEFIILASNSIDVDALYPVHFYDTSESLIARAWYSKYEQSYQKAKLTFGNSSAFDTVDEIYNKKQAQLQIRKKKRLVLRVLLFLLPVLPILLVLLFIIMI